MLRKAVAERPRPIHCGDVKPGPFLPLAILLLGRLAQAGQPGGETLFRDKVFPLGILGFALTEAIALFALLISFLILFM